MMVCDVIFIGVVANSASVVVGVVNVLVIV